MCLGKWKLIYYYEDRRFELFDIAADISEQSNLAEVHPETRDRLVRRLQDFLDSTNAQFPIDKRTGKTLRVPQPEEK